MFDYLRHLVSITFVIASFALSAQSPDIALHNVADSACTQSENVAPVDECQPLETQESITTMAIDDNEQQVTATRDIKLYEPPKAPDFNFIKSRTNPAVKPYKFLDDQTWVGIPLFLSGLIAKSEKTAFRQDYNNPNTKIRLIKTNFHNEIDNYTQYVPLALTIGLKIAGVESRSDWPRFWASSAASAAIMAGLVNGIKYTASEMRPDGSTRNSWPSGHTATAFVGATILHKE